MSTRIIKPSSPRLDPAHPLAQGLVLGFVLSEGAGDDLHNIVDGRSWTISGSGTDHTWTTYRGPVLTWDGDDTVDVVPQGARLDAISTEATLVWRTKIPSMGGGGNFSTFFNHHGAPNSHGWFLQQHQSTDTLSVRVDNANGDQSGKAQTGTLFDNTWMEVVMRIDDGDITMFVNGEVESTGTYSTASGWSNTDGIDYDDAGVPRDDAHVYYYNRALSDREIEQLYENPYAFVRRNAREQWAGVEAARSIEGTANDLRHAHRLESPKGLVSGPEDVRLRKPTSPRLNTGHPFAQGLVTGYVHAEGGGTTFHEITTGKPVDYTGTSTSWAHGEDIGPVVRYDGADNGAANFNNSRVAALNRTATIFFRAKLEPPAGSDQHEAPIRHHSGSAGWFFQQHKDTDTVGVRIDNSEGTHPRIAQTGSVMDGRWHDFAIRIDDGDITIFVDRVEESSGTYPVGNGWGNDAGFEIQDEGMERDEAYVYYYDRALSDDRIRQIQRDPYAIVRGVDSQLWATQAPADPDDLRHPQRLESPTGSGSFVGDPNDLRHAHRLEQATGSIGKFATANDLRHAHRLETVTVTYTYVEDANDLRHPQRLESPDGTTPTHVATPFDLRHAHRLTTLDIPNQNGRVLLLRCGMGVGGNLHDVAKVNTLTLSGGYSWTSNGIQFDGVSGQARTSQAIEKLRELTIFLAMHVDSEPGSDSLGVLSVPNNFDVSISTPNDGTDEYRLEYNWGGPTLRTTDRQVGRWHVFGIRQRKDDAAIFINQDKLVTDVGSASNYDSADLILGSRLYSDAYAHATIAFVGVWAETFSDSDMVFMANEIRRYLFYDRGLDPMEDITAAEPTPQPTVTDSIRILQNR